MTPWCTRPCAIESIDDGRAAGLDAGDVRPRVGAPARVPASTGYATRGDPPGAPYPKALHRSVQAAYFPCRGTVLVSKAPAFEAIAMAIWKDQAPRQNPAPEPTRFDAPKPEAVAPPVAVPAAPRSDAERARKESLIASDITIEGKIEGAGNVRIAGKFKGDVNVQGDLTIESGAKLTGGVRADKVTIAGELEGNIEQATRCDLQSGGSVVGDIKAGSLTVASGARMKGSAQFGWDDGGAPKGGRNGSAEGGGAA
jgi:cytoskeletal protein CcmA (bactofilin family)